MQVYGIHSIFFPALMTLILGTGTHIFGQDNARKEVLAYFKSISGRRTILAQHNREPNAEPSLYTDKIHDSTGKYPAMWSGDFLFQDENIKNRWKMIHEAEKQWKMGAIVEIMLHTCPPVYGEPCGWDEANGVLSHLPDTVWKELITDGSPLNSKWKSRLDIIAGYLQYLDDKGVAVLFRPLHEMNQGRFWWGGRKGPDGTARLYKITHDYLTKTMGIQNLIWIWDVQDLDYDWASYDPGGDYWDIMALDIYDDASGYSLRKYNEILKIAGDKPIAIGECQRLPTSGQLHDQPRWTFVMPWAELVFNNNSIGAIRELYTSANMITLDKMPGW
jgi:mannan endo-1,4-beta-mannosidase